MLEGLDRDPGGRPCCALGQKLRTAPSPLALTVTLLPSFQQEVVEGLLLQRAKHMPPLMADSVGDDGGLEVDVPPVRNHR